MASCCSPPRPGWSGRRGSSCGSRSPLPIRWGLPSPAPNGKGLYGNPDDTCPACRPGRQDFVKVFRAASRLRQNGSGAGGPGPTVRICLASQACHTKVLGGPMTVVAGIVALLLLGYLVVALLKPEQF